MSQSIRVPAILVLEAPRSLLDLVSRRQFAITTEECAGMRGYARAEAARAAGAPRNPALFEIKPNSGGGMTLRKYGLGCVPPFPMPIGQYLRSGYLKRGATLAELAGQVGIEAKALERTVTAFNAGAREGRNPAFGKGSRA
jgi:hypothetical protein